MSFLGSGELRILLKAHPPILDPYCGKAIEGSGLEVRVDKIAEFSSPAGVLGVKDKRTPGLVDVPPRDCVLGIPNGWVLTPQRFYHLTTLERINMPKSLSGIITPRSTLQRCGVGLFVANIAPGYHGELSFGILNFRSQPFFLEREARVAFIQFAELKEQEDECCYEGNYQGGKRGTEGRSEEHIKGTTNSCL